MTDNSPSMALATEPRASTATGPKGKRKASLMGRMLGTLVALASILAVVYVLWLVVEPFVSGRPKLVARGATFDETGWRVCVEANLRTSEFSDTDVRCLRYTPFLTAVSLQNANVTDASAPTLARLRRLRRLDLSGTHITDATLEQLATLPRLEILHLTGTDISEHGLAMLGAAPQLKVLTLTDCPAISPKDILELARKHPDMAIAGSCAGPEGLTIQDVKNLLIAREYWLDRQPDGARASFGATIDVEIPTLATCLELYMPEVIDEIKIGSIGEQSLDISSATGKVTNPELSEVVAAFRSWVLSHPNVKRIRIGGWWTENAVIELMEVPRVELIGMPDCYINNRPNEPTISPDNLELLFARGLVDPIVTLIEPTEPQLEVIKRQSIRRLRLPQDFSEILSLEEISQWSSLELLELSDEFLTNIDFTPLTRLKNLDGVYVNCPQLDPVAVANLHDLLPQAHFGFSTRPVPPEVLDRLAPITLQPSASGVMTARYTQIKPVRPQDYSNLSQYGPWDRVLYDVWGQPVDYNAVVTSELETQYNSR